MVLDEVIPPAHHSQGSAPSLEGPPRVGGHPAADFVPRTLPRTWLSGPETPWIIFDARPHLCDPVKSTGI